MAQSHFHHTTVIRGDDEIEITVEIEVGSWGAPATYWEPSDPIEAWVANGKIEHDGPPEFAVILTEAEEEKIVDAFCEDPPEPDFGPDPDDWYDQQRNEPDDRSGDDWS